jgi:hypothetical protein
MKPLLSDRPAQMRMEDVEDWLIIQRAERLQLDPADMNTNELRTVRYD